jgi:nucleoid DNA-binding protein
MNSRQTASEIVRRLPYLRRRDVQDVLEVLTELWGAELAKPDGQILITGLGKLYVEVHPLRTTGIVREQLRDKLGKEAPEYIQRRSIRFRPSDKLRATFNPTGDAADE